MKAKRATTSHLQNKTGPATATQDQVDGLLAEIARLYRERFRALYNNDQPTLQTVTEQIALLKSKLTPL